MRIWFLTGAVLALTLAGMAGMFATTSRPVLPSLVLGLLVCLGGFFYNRRSAWSAWWFNFAFLFLVLAAVEGLMGSKEKRFEGEGCGVASRSRHPDLGFALIPGVQTRCKKLYKDTLLFDVTYTVEPSGLRVAPPRDDEPDACVVFLGGSFTYGAGVRDEQTFAYRVGASSGGSSMKIRFTTHR